jgi:single-strand DNA-binding protein
MSAVNKVILVGNLGADPEQRAFPSGGLVTNLRIATSEFRKSRDNGKPTEHTEWHRVVLFDRLAELASQYLHKGSQVYIEGKLRTRKFQTQNGTQKYITEVIAEQLQFLGGTSNERKVEQPGNSMNTSQPSQPLDHFDDSDIPF